MCCNPLCPAYSDRRHVFPTLFEGLVLYGEARYLLCPRPHGAVDSDIQTPEVRGKRATVSLDLPNIVLLN